MHSTSDNSAERGRRTARTATAICLLGMIAASTVSAEQTASPTGTVSAGSWTASGAASLHAATATNDGDTSFASNSTQSSTMELALSAVNDPQVSTGHFIRITFKSIGGSAKEYLTFELYEGATPITTKSSLENRTTYQTPYAEWELLTTEADAIGNYSNLRYRVTSSQLGGGEHHRVTFLSLVVPDPPSLVPAIGVRGTNGAAIATGDATPSPADGTDFGSVDVSGGTRDHVFSITNTGGALLNLSDSPAVSISGAHAADFTVIAQPATNIAAGAGTTFTLRFDPSATGTRTGSVSIANNDTSANPYTFAILGTGVTPEIDVRGTNGNSITTGDATPSTADGTDFGSVDVSGVTRDHVFSITNTGGALLNLSGSPAVSISGAHAADFTVTAQPATNIAAGAGTSFTIRFDPSAAGARTGSVSIANTDTNENPYTFTILGTGVTPEIDVRGTNAASIATGDTTPSTTDGTDYGEVNIAGGTRDHVFSITNTGTALLNLSGSPAVSISGAHAADFTVTAQPATNIAAGAGSSFTIRFDPSAAGARTGSVSIANTDTNENPYTFAIVGTGIVALTAPTLTSPTHASIGTSDATLGATITSDGGEAITARGTVWGTTATPTGNSLTEGGTGVGAFSHARAALPTAARIYYRGWATNSIGIGYSPDGMFFTEPDPASSVSFTNIGAGSFQVSWACGAGTGAIVVVRASSAVSNAPTDGIEHSADPVFGNGANLGGGDYVVFRAIGTNITVTGLAGTTTYHVAVYTYAGTGTVVNYQQDTPATGNQTTDSAGASPSLVAPSVAAIGQTNATVGANITTNGGAAITARGTVWDTVPNPTANPLAAGGTATGVYTHVRYDLPSATHVYFRGYAANSAGTGYSPQSEFWTEPLPASALSFDTVSSNSMKLLWSNGNGSGRLVVMRQGSAVTAAPGDGTNYTANNVFGSGQQILPTQYVMYIGSAASVVVTNLTPNTLYFAAVYEYAGGGTSVTGINYRQTGPATGSETTMATNPPTHNAARGIGCDTCHATSHGGIGTFVPRNGEQQAICKTCHNPAGQAGSLSDVTNHFNNAGTIEIDCGSCHYVHNIVSNLISVNTHVIPAVVGTNLSYIRANMKKYWPQATTNTVFQSRPAHFAFASTDGPWNGVCQSCHTNNDHYTNASTNDNHNTGQNCTTCHSHDNKFKGVGGDCTGCHASFQNDGSNAARRAIMGDFDLTAHHVPRASITTNDCKVCHYEAVDPTYHMNNQVDLRNPDNTNVSALISFTNNFSRNTSVSNLESWVTNVMFNFCLNCHDSDGATQATTNANKRRPFSVGTMDAPDVKSLVATSNRYHHAIMAAGTNANCNSTTMVSPWNRSGAHNRISCFDCHAANGHGGANQAMLLDPIDFVTMTNTAAKADLPAGMGNTVETFCIRCHASSIYQSGNAGSVYERHGTDQQQHSATANELGCMGCHGGVKDFGGFGGSGNGARRGNIHGGSFVWPSGSGSPAVQTRKFLVGGWLSGWGVPSTIKGQPGIDCGGGDCNHSLLGQGYTLGLD